MKRGDRVIAILFLAFSLSSLILACSGGGGGGGGSSPAATTTPLTATATEAAIFGTADKISLAVSKPSVSGGGVKAAASPFSGATVTAIKSSGATAGSTTTAEDGTYALLLPKSDTYAIKITSGGIVMKAVYAVGLADVTINVNPGSTAAVLILEKSLNTTFDSGTAFNAAVGNVDVNSTITTIAATTDFTTTANAVATVVAANANPVTDSTVSSAATTASASVPVADSSIVGSWLGTVTDSGGTYGSVTFVFTPTTATIGAGSNCEMIGPYTTSGNSLNVTITATNPSGCKTDTQLAGTFTISGNTLTIGVTSGAGGTFTGTSLTDCTQIAGTWYGNQLHAGPSSAAMWVRNTVTVAADCTVTPTAYLDSTGATTLGTAWTGTLDTNGIMRRSTVPSLRGMLMLNKQVMVITRTEGDGVTVNMHIWLKAGSGYAQADLAGTHEMRLLRAGTAPLWAYGTATHDSLGNATAMWTDSGGSSGAGTPSVQTLASDGSVTDSLNASWLGRLSSAKDFFVATATMNSGSADMIVGTGSGTGFTTADLAGGWRWFRLQVGAGPHWARGRLSIDAAGAVTQLSYGDSAGGNTPGAAFTFAISSTGAVTRADDATYHGQMLPTKDGVISVQTNSAGNSYRLIIVRKE